MGDDPCRKLEFDILVAKDAIEDWTKQINVLNADIKKAPDEEKKDKLKGLLQITKEAKKQHIDELEKLKKKLEQCREPSQKARSINQKTFKRLPSF
ncbi:MAG: hypothetical protein ACFFG0_07075 [Candidatus Thorarchaeota archaeon]